MITIFFPFNSNTYHFSSLRKKGLPSCDDRKWLMKILEIYITWPAGFQFTNRAHSEN